MIKLFIQSCCAARIVNCRAHHLLAGLLQSHRKNIRPLHVPAAVHHIKNNDPGLQKQCVCVCLHNYAYELYSE